MENAPSGVLKKIDRGMMMIWVEAADRHQRAIVAQSIFEAERGGMVAQTTEGNFVHSPYPTIIAQAARLMLKVGSELGFTPASRPRLVAPGSSPTLPNDEPEDGLERLLASHPARKCN